MIQNERGRLIVGEKKELNMDYIMEGYSFLFINIDGKQESNLTDIDLSTMIRNSTIKSEDKIIYRPHSFLIRENIMFYLIKDDIIIGFIESSINKDRRLLAFDIYIDYLKLHPDFIGQKICKIMMKMFINTINIGKSEPLSFVLENFGGIPACRCYINSFSELGYTAFDAITTTNLSIDKCDEYDEILMGFMYGMEEQLVHGGKNKKKSNKKKSNKRIHYK